ELGQRDSLVFDVLDRERRPGCLSLRRCDLIAQPRRRLLDALGFRRRRPAGKSWLFYDDLAVLICWRRDLIGGRAARTGRERQHPVDGLAERAAQHAL